MHFEALLVVHVLAGLARIVAGDALPKKRRNRHTAAGRIYLTLMSGTRGRT